MCGNLNDITITTMDTGSVAMMGHSLPVPKCGETSERMKIRLKFSDINRGYPPPGSYYLHHPAMDIYFLFSAHRVILGKDARVQ
ncbi:hypothetical protein L873DRAFT_1818064 [Choiromyces venosus 120613-1]|uniref:Uncharacterized protein n=1 Tax=Choiromyces venosus 120613-1 TaxID=1336337 RepID=A0A3N4J1Y1_9PEZI|nr:hypothetical protein L873DRAFT_1818064 [Choiromyces venosus 120613-1]